jgi:hypothetical protein
MHRKKEGFRQVGGFCTLFLNGVNIISICRNFMDQTVKVNYLTFTLQCET